MLPRHNGAVIPVDHECGFLRTRSRLKRPVRRLGEGGSLERCEQALALVRHSGGYGLRQEHHDVGAGVAVPMVAKVLLTPAVEVMRVVRMLPLCRDFPELDVALAAARRRHQFWARAGGLATRRDRQCWCRRGRWGGGGEGFALAGYHHRAASLGCFRSSREVVREPRVGSPFKLGHRFNCATPDRTARGGFL